MADSAAFAFACGELERLTKLTREEARGTVRLALRDAGFSASAIGAREMKVVFERLMPKELASRRIEGGDQLCAEIGQRVGELREATPAATPEAVFGRLGGR
jgi:hypothetical protein